jgi:hypothetical protein
MPYGRGAPARLADDVAVTLFHFTVVVKQGGIVGNGFGAGYGRACHKFIGIEEATAQGDNQ